MDVVPVAEVLVLLQIDVPTVQPALPASSHKKVICFPALGVITSVNVTPVASEGP